MNNPPTWCPFDHESSNSNVLEHEVSPSEVYPWLIQAGFICPFGTEAATKWDVLAFDVTGLSGQELYTSLTDAAKKFIDGPYSNIIFTLPDEDPINQRDAREGFLDFYEALDRIFRCICNDIISQHSFWSLEHPIWEAVTSQTVLMAKKNSDCDPCDILYVTFEDDSWKYKGLHAFYSWPDYEWWNHRYNTRRTLTFTKKEVFTSAITSSETTAKIRKYLQAAEEVEAEKLTQAIVEEGMVDMPTLWSRMFPFPDAIWKGEYQSLVVKEQRPTDYILQNISSEI